MSDVDLLAFIMRVLRAVDPMECESVLWRTDGKYAPVTFFVNCSDDFWWGTADMERITPENIALLEQSYADAGAAVEHGQVYGQLLFCCRARQMRPQGCRYPEMRELWPLLDACGPERPVGLGNPYLPGKRLSGGKNGVSVSVPDPVEVSR